MHYNVVTNKERSRVLRQVFQRLSNDDIKPVMKALHITDKIKSRDEAIERTATVKLLPDPSKSSEANMDAIFRNLNIPQPVCFLFIFRDMD